MKPIYIFYVTAFLFCISLNAQDDTGWQWTERGGSAATFDYGSQFRDYGMERIMDLAVDSDNNYYYLAEVAGYTITLGDTEFETYNDNAGKRDVFVFSTDSEGNYRWSKMIGGGANDKASSLGVDGQDNVYVSGATININPNTMSYDTPVHFDTDSVMDPETSEPGPNNKRSFLIKYNSAGEYQWLRQPDGDEVFSDYTGGLVKTVVEPNGHTHSLTWFGVGTHLNGQLMVEDDGEGDFTFKAVIVNYDENGALMDFIPLDMHPAFSLYKYQLAYDPDLDRYYIADTYRNGDGILGIGDYGNDTNAFYLAAVNNQGDVLWYHGNQTQNGYCIGDLQLDSEGDLYFTGSFQSDTGQDSFAGYTFEMGDNFTIQDPFLVKLNPDGNLLWGSNAQLYSPFNGQSIVIRGNEVYLGLGSLQNSWDGVDMPGPQGQGLVPDIMIMRFNAQTGEAQEVIHDQNTPSQDAIMAMALDNNGDLITGGYFGSDLFYGTDLHLNDNAQDSDFFIAKYHLEELGVETRTATSLKAHPNPTNGMINLRGKTALQSYSLYDLQGRLVQDGKLKSNQIDLSGLENGVYILGIETQNGKTQNIKVVKE